MDIFDLKGSENIDETSSENINELYRDLRNLFNGLISNILGTDYCNAGDSPYMIDFYACRDALKKYDKIRCERNAWRIGFWLSQVLAVILYIVD